MTQRRDRQTTTPVCILLRLLVMLALVVTSVALVVGCSTESRYRIKTIIFTGVPPLHGEASEDATATQDPRQAAQAEQMARQQQHREALITKYWQHGPFAAGECERCHNLGQSKSFLGNQDTTTLAPGPVAQVSASSRLLLPRQRLCATCHTHHGTEFVQGLGLQHHLPAATGECTACHSPHQSLRQYMLRKSDNHELCSSCHQPATLSPVHMDSPERDCIDCHNAHVGVSRSLLRSDTSELGLLYGGGSDE